MDLTPTASALEVAAALQRARQARDRGDPAAAELAFLAVLAARPHLVPVELELARLRLGQGQVEDAARQLRQRLAFAAPEPECRAEREELEALLLEALLRLERWGEAEPLLRRLRARGQAAAHHHLALALAVDAQGREEEGLTVLRQGVALEPLDLALWLELARRLGRWRRWPEAIAAWDRAVALAPEREDLLGERRATQGEALWQRGEEALAAEDWRAAERAFRGLRDLQPDHAPAGRRLELLRQLAPTDLPPEPTAGLDEPGDWRQQARQRLAQFGRLLDRLEADQPPLR